MPIPEDRLYNADKLNRWFAVSSLLMTLSLVWMIAVDYDRPWRRFQDDYFVGKATLAHLDFLEATRDERLQEIEEAGQRLQDAEQLLAQTEATRLAELNDEVTQAVLKFSVTDGRWSRKEQVLEVTRDTYEKMLNKYGPDHHNTKEAHTQLTEEEDEVERLRKDKELWEDTKTRLEAELKRHQEPVRAAKKRLAELEQVAADALRKDRAYRGTAQDEGMLRDLLGDAPIVRAIINAPLLDFTAPKTTSGRHQVKQLVLPDVRQRLNYLESYTTDRCTTCHVAIDDPEFAKDRLAQKLERALAAINEARQRNGEELFELPLPPVLKGYDQALMPGNVTDHWDKLTAEQQDHYFEAVLKLVNAYLSSSGRKTIDLGQPILAHPDLGLYVSVNSPHPMAKMGCTVCHEGNPQETDFVQAAHSPPTHVERKRWEDEYYVRHLSIPSVTFETIEHYWDRPMLLPQYSEAGCAKCHAEISDIAVFEGERKGSRINLGRHLFVTVGCVNCHSVDPFPNPRRVGADLTHLASKLQPEFVQQWVFFPQKFRPSTRMPHFFLQENNRAEAATSLDPKPVLRTEAEVAAISKYLFTVSSQWQPIEKPAEVEGGVERGRKLFRSVGCLGCHANIAEFGEEWITGDIAQRERVDTDTARHRYLGMTYEQRVRYAMEHFAGEVDTYLEPETARFNPDEPYSRPTFSRFGPELSGIGSKVSFEWLYSWLIEPAHYSPDTKMPRLRLTPPEAADLAAYLMTLKNDDFKQGVFELNTERREMVDDLVFTLLSAQRSERRSRAVMDDEGGELRDILVELLASSFGREPDTGLVDLNVGRERASALIDPMSVEDKKLMYLGNKLIAHYGCYTCHEIRGFESTTPVGTDLSSWAEKPVSQLDFAFYDHAFHDMREEKEEVFGFVYPQNAEQLNYWSPIDDRAREQVSHTHAAFAKHKMLNPRIWDREKLKKPYDLLKMPNFYFDEEEAEALSAFLLSRIPPRVNDVLKIDYEGDSSGPIARGRNLTRELGCIGCHQIEDNAPTIQQYFRRVVGGLVEFDEINAPPLLWGQGAKVQHNWFHRFLQQVEPLRPWLQVRMPSFALTGEQATVLTEYFAALSRHDAEKLKEARAAIDEYIEEQKTRTNESAAASRDKLEPGADWFEQESLERHAVRLRRWAIERKLMRSSVLDPLQTEHGRFRAAHATLLDRTGFMEKLYDVAYPFVEPPRPMTSRDRFEQGGRFLTDMGCLQCHVLGNMLPGPAENTDDFVQMYRLDSVRGEGVGPRCGRDRARSVGDLRAELSRGRVVRRRHTKGVRIAAARVNLLT